MTLLNAYQFDNYRTLIREYLDFKKANEPGLSFAALADIAKIQRSYLSHVLADRANLNADQLYLVGQALGWDEGISDYALLLLEIERCDVTSRKKALVERRKALQRTHLRSKAALSGDRGAPSESVAEYYCDQYAPLVHMFLLIGEYRGDLEAIARRLGVATAKIVEVARLLERCQVVKAGKSGYEVVAANLHLEPGSPWARVHATLMRSKAIEVRQRAASDEDYFFTASFAADERARLKIKTHFLGFLKEMGATVEAAPSAEVFHVNFDLFKV